MTTPHLTPRMLDTLHLLASGYKTPDIARELHVTEHTVKSHTKRLFAALGVHTAAHAVAVAYHRSILGGDAALAELNGKLGAKCGEVVELHRQLDSARAWAVEWQQRADLLAWLLAEEQHHATEHDCCVADLEERNATLSSLLRGMARRSITHRMAASLFFRVATAPERQQDAREVYRSWCEEGLGWVPEMRHTNWRAAWREVGQALGEVEPTDD